MKSKIYILFFLFVFFIGFCSATTLTVSPTQIDFIGKTNEIICNKVKISVEDTQILEGKTKWAEQGQDERILSMHKLNANELDLDVTLPKIIEIYESSEIEVCIKGSKKGNYHGALLYKIEDKPVQVGIWMNVSLEENSLMKITGNFIKTEDKRGNMGVYFAVMLFLILGGLVVWSKKRNR